MSLTHHRQATTLCGKLLHLALRILALAAVAAIPFSGCATAMTPHDGRRDAIVKLAIAMRDTDYELETKNGKSGFDCSGLAHNVYAKTGVRIPQTAKEQYEKAIKISRYQLRQGDLVFFSISGQGGTYVGIYIGGNNFVHAPSPGTKIRLSSLGEPQWRETFLGGGSFL